jgi:hypothetical protein
VAIGWGSFVGNALIFPENVSKPGNNSSAQAVGSLEKVWREGAGEFLVKGEEAKGRKKNSENFF